MWDLHITFNVNKYGPNYSENDISNTQTLFVREAEVPLVRVNLPKLKH